ncbi:hypothetical protein [Pseudomonas oryzihabitans]|uniref:hypothetical protein n=1 Tax=Pseudomonas oryzihabitans TaxID=47885 RepID=UPI002894BDF0|nr:hypothetical protein [Pseudomonas oryzihabitans]MDT3722834.1 hypothetical protein [Pseudomonas oryzihabitans]
MTAAPIWVALSTFASYRPAVGFTRSLYADYINSVLMVEVAMATEQKGYDGLYLAGWGDPLREMREMSNISFASVGEQSMLTVLAMARRFVMVTVSDKTTAAIKRAAHVLLASAMRSHGPRPYSDAELLLKAIDAP